MTEEQKIRVVGQVLKESVNLKIGNGSCLKPPDGQGRRYIDWEALAALAIGEYKDLSV